MFDDYHKDDSGGTGEHVLSTDGAIALKVTFNAPVVVLEVNIHADVALLAVEKVLVQSVANPADPTVWAMVNRLGGVVIPELADVAVVLCKLGVATVAVLGSRLNGLATHTEHHLCFVPTKKYPINHGQHFHSLSRTLNEMQYYICILILGREERAYLTMAWLHTSSWQNLQLNHLPQQLAFSLHPLL